MRAWIATAHPALGGARRCPARLARWKPSARYLRHLREAWDQQFKKAPLAEQEVVLTVPASFDAAARDLTLKAAEQAGLPRITLIEEPQAALYAWCEAMGENSANKSGPAKSSWWWTWAAARPTSP